MDAPPAAARNPRLHELDWLRVLAVTLLIAVHAASAFDPYPPFGLKGQPTPPLIVFATFFHQWRLCLILLISGAGSHIALNSIGAGAYLRMRLTRLAVPLIVGSTCIIPIETFAIVAFHADHPVNPFRFYRNLWHATLWPHSSAFPFTIFWGALWFLGYLLLYSFLCLPVFRLLESPRWRNWIGAFAAVVERRPHAVMLLAAPVIVVEWALRARWPIETRRLFNDWEAFARYGCFFVLGFLILCDRRLYRAVASTARMAVALGVVSSSAVVYLLVTRRAPEPGVNPAWIGYMALAGVNAWLWASGALGLAIRLLSFSNPVLRYLTDAAYPVYILHIPVLAGCGGWLLRLPISPYLQFAALTGTSLAVSIAIYELAIRRFRVMRFFFGLRIGGRRSRPAAPQSAEPDFKSPVALGSRPETG